MSVTDPFLENINNMELKRQLQLNDNDEHTKHLQETYTELKKAKQAYQENTNAINELMNLRAKATSNAFSKDKGEEKVNNKIIYHNHIIFEIKKSNIYILKYFVHYFFNYSLCV